MGEHEWCSYDDMSFQTWDRFARDIMYKGQDIPRSFRGGKPKLYRYHFSGGYRYWIVGKILNRVKI